MSKGYGKISNRFCDLSSRNFIFYADPDPSFENDPGPSPENDPDLSPEMNAYPSPGKDPDLCPKSPT